jgi:hypothetical protein
MNPDFAEMLSALSEAGAEYMVVGAHALAVHGRPRATGDLDIWIRATAENAERVWTALELFGAPLDQLRLPDLHSADVVFQMGLPPKRIDILTSITGVEFEDAWGSRVIATVGALNVPTIGKDQLIRNKRATGRPRDLVDAEELERMS